MIYNRRCGDTRKVGRPQAVSKIGTGLFSKISQSACCVSAVVSQHQGHQSASNSSKPQASCVLQEGWSFGGRGLTDESKENIFIGHRTASEANSFTAKAELARWLVGFRHRWMES